MKSKEKENIQLNETINFNANLNNAKNNYKNIGKKTKKKKISKNMIIKQNKNNFSDVEKSKSYSNFKLNFGKNIYNEYINERKR